MFTHLTTLSKVASPVLFQLGEWKDNRVLEEKNKRNGLLLEFN